MPPGDAGRDGSGKPIGLLKMVSLDGSLDGRRVRIARLDVPGLVRGSGGAGEAGDLVAAVLESARVGGHSLALALTSESGGTGALDGFQPLPCSEAACRTVLPVQWPKEPEWLRAGEDPLRFVPGLRPWRPDDLEEVAAIHAETIARQRLRIDRGAETWERILPAQDAPFFVIERSGRVDAYVLLGAGRPTVRWREHGARRGAEELLPGLHELLLQLLFLDHQGRDVLGRVHPRHAGGPTGLRHLVVDGGDLLLEIPDVLLLGAPGGRHQRKLSRPDV